MNTDAQKRFLIRFCYAAVILAIAVFLCRKALPVLAPFVVALLVSLLLKPIVRFLHGRCRVHKGVAAAVTVVLFYCLLGLALTLLFVKLFASAKAFVLDLPRLYNTVVEPLLETVSAELERFIARLDPAALSSISGLLESAGASLEQAVLNFSGRALTTLGGYAISVPGWLLNTLIMIIATVFITADYPLLKGFVLGQLSAPQRQRAHEIRVHLGKTLGRYVRSYALILLWGEGLPCVFYGDWYGIPHDNINPVGGDLAVLLRVRAERAFGARRAYLDDPNVIGWTLEGDDAHPGSGLAVILSDGAGGQKQMTLGPRHAGATFAPVTGGGSAVVLDETGSATFSVEGGDVRVYIRV